MFRGIIIDNLNDNLIETKKYKSEESARIEAQEVIKRLCKKYKVELNDCRFEMYAISIT